MEKRTLKHSACQYRYNSNEQFRYGFGWVTSGKKLSHDLIHRVWSPVVFKGGRRCDDGWQFCDWLALDFDSGETTLNEAVENLFCDYQHIIGTTKSHQVEKNGITCDRFRVLIPWETRITDSELYRSNLRHLIRQYGADSQCGSLSHSYAPCREIVSINRDPEAYRMEVLDLKPLPKPEAWDGTPQVLSRFVIQTMRNGFIREGWRDKTLFRLSKDMFKADFNSEQILKNLLKLKIEPALSERYIRRKIDAAWKHLKSEVERG